MDDRRAPGEQLGLRDVALHAGVRRDGVDRSGMVVGTDRDDHLDVLLGQTGQDRPEHLGVTAKERSKRQVHTRGIAGAALVAGRGAGRMASDSPAGTVCPSRDGGLSSIVVPRYSPP